MIPATHYNNDCNTLQQWLQHSATMTATHCNNDYWMIPDVCPKNPLHYIAPHCNTPQHTATHLKFVRPLFFSLPPLVFCFVWYLFFLPSGTCFCFTLFPLCFLRFFVLFVIVFSTWWFVPFVVLLFVFFRSRWGCRLTCSIWTHALGRWACLFLRQVLYIDLIYTNIQMHIYIYICIYTYIHVCMCKYICVYMYIKYLYIQRNVCIYAYQKYVCLCVCVYIYIFIYNWRW